MKKNKWRAALVVGVLGVTVVGAYRLGSVYAEGAPTATPLYYSGYATESGAPIDGNRDVRIELWRDATSTDIAMRACETIRNSAAFVEGHFRVALDPTCVDATRANPNLFVELLIGGTRIGERAAIGAVPYALEADHAVSATQASPSGALDTRLSALETPSAFLARNTTAQSIANGTAPTVIFDDEIYDRLDEYDPATGVFSPRRAGVYEFSCNVFFNGSTAQVGYLEAGVFLNGTRVDVDGGQNDTFRRTMRARSALSLVVGDEVTCRAYQNTGGAVPLSEVRPGEALSTFSAFRVGS